MQSIRRRLLIVGILVAVAGAAVAAGGFLYGKPQADDGLASAQAVYADQELKLSYNEQGQLIDRGTPEGARRILNLLVNEWKFPLNEKNLDPNDPLVDTRDELMYEYATITYHVLNSTVAVKLAAKDVPIAYRGVTYSTPGTYNITVQKYYAQLDRTNPIEKQLRDAWTPQALGLLSSLSGGHANQATGELARATTVGIGAIGLLFGGAGGGLVWAGFGASAVPKGRPALARESPSGDR